MKKLKTVMRYECVTSFRYIWYFYAIQYAIVALISLIVGISLGGIEHVGTNGLELNTLIYIGVIGVLSFHEDFKMLIQNGFPRSYIFGGVVAMFVCVSGTMALVDTAVANTLHGFLPSYESLYGMLYGYGNIFVNWVLLFLINLTVCTGMLLFVLVMNKLGKRMMVLVCVALAGAMLLLVAVFRFVLSPETATAILRLVTRAFGFMSGGGINFFLPCLTLLLLLGALGACAYAVLRRTELKSA